MYSFPLQVNTIITCLVNTSSMNNYPACQQNRSSDGSFNSVNELDLRPVKVDYWQNADMLERSHEKLEFKMLVELGVI